MPDTDKSPLVWVHLEQTVTPKGQKGSSSSSEHSKRGDQLTSSVCLFRYRCQHANVNEKQQGEKDQNQLYRIV